MLQRKVLFPIICLLISKVESRQQHGESVYTSTVIYSSCVQDTFLLDVSLPCDYENDTTYYYPLVILTDGNWRRPQHSAIQVLSNSGVIRKVVIVGISYPDSYDIKTKRKRDFLSEAARFFCFIRDEVIPYLYRHYRLTEERLLWGSSFGGYFVLYALFQDVRHTKKWFRHYIAASPAILELTPLNGNPMNLFAYEELYAQQCDSLPVNLYITVGSEEDKSRFYEPFKRFVEQVSRRNYRGLNFHWSIDSGKTHFTVWEPTLYDGLRMFLRQSHGGEK
ncbi:MAG: alpha/beta hydrolase-fold protein [Bacteroidetes bacterium]|nr:alpha/beta hydrolase-fold protein [Bacteroidota bacterium]